MWVEASYRTTLALTDQKFWLALVNQNEKTNGRLLNKYLLLSKLDVVILRLVFHLSKGLVEGTNRLTLIDEQTDSAEDFYYYYRSYCCCRRHVAV